MNCYSITFTLTSILFAARHLFIFFKGIHIHGICTKSYGCPSNIASDITTTDNNHSSF